MQLARYRGCSVRLTAAECRQRRLEHGISSQPDYQEKYSFGDNPIMGALATVLCIVALAFLDDLPIGDDSETTREIVRYVLYLFTFFGVVGTVRSLVLAIKKRTALRVDEMGVTTRGVAFRDKRCDRKHETTPWNQMLIIIIQHRNASPNGAGKTHLRLCRYSDHGEAVDIAIEHSVERYDINWDKLKDTARFYSPNIAIEEKRRRGPLSTTRIACPLRQFVCILTYSVTFRSILLSRPSWALRN